MEQFDADVDGDLKNFGWAISIFDRPAITSRFKPDLHNSKLFYLCLVQRNNMKTINNKHWCWHMEAKTLAV